MIGKPKVVIFREPLDLFPANNHHVLVYKMDKCYSFYFDCIIVDYPSDYNEIIDKYEPDFVLFHIIHIEFFVKNIKNIQKSRNIVKVIVGIIDTSDAGRYFVGSFMEKYNIDCFFHPGCDLKATYPEISKYLFNFPHFIDSDLNYDYGIGKYIPILLTGSIGGNYYVWRERVLQPLIANFPTLFYRHPGYNLESNIPDILRIHGENYFKTLSASYIAPTCGSIKNVLIMKHLEIPGAGCCLICEESDTVKAHGFKDMENCVFASPDNIVEKVKYLFENRNLLDQITKNGYEFVHSYHTYKQRPQILQWYELFKIKNAGQRIVQPSILGDLELVDQESKKETIYYKDADDINMITKIDDLIYDKKYYKADIECKKVINIAEYIHDAKLRLYIIHMLQKRHAYGFKTLKILLWHKGDLMLLPDPINLSFFILHLLATNDIDKAVYYSRVGITKRRKELDYVRLLSFSMGGENQLHDSLLSETNKPHDENEYKSFYYFYSKRFDLLEIIKLIALENIKGITKKILNSQESFHHLSPLSLNDIEEPFDPSTLDSDIIVHDLRIKINHKIEKKLQEFIYKTRESFVKH